MSKNRPSETGCLVCGDELVYSRGLCQKHYRQFKTAFDAFKTSLAAEAFEEKTLNAGWILPRQAGGRPKSWSPFAELANEIREQHDAYGDDELKPEQIVADGNEVIKKAVAKRKATRPASDSKPRKKRTR